MVAATAASPGNSRSTGPSSVHSPFARMVVEATASPGEE